MAISKKELKRLFSEVFDETEKVEIQGEAQQSDFLDKYLPVVKAGLGKNVSVGGISKGATKYAQGGWLNYKNISLRPTNHNFGFYSFDITFSEGILMFGNRYQDIKPFKDISKVQLFFDGLDKLFEIEANKAKKKEKINQLKAGAVKALVKQMADEDGFAYSFAEDSVKVTVWVRLSKTNALAVYIPYSKFQEAVQKIRPIIANIIAMQEEGVVFKIKASGGMYWTESEKTGKTIF